jgi:ATP-dependent DNA helicase RecG
MIKGSYIRVGDSDKLMTDYEIYRYETYKKQIRNDLRVIANTSVSQLNDQRVAELLAFAKAEKTNLAVVDDKTALELLGIVNNGNATLTGWMLFNDYPQSFFPQFSVTAIVLPGTQMGETGEYDARFVDNKRFDGDFQTVLSETEKFILRNMKNNTIVNDFGKRKDKYEYPIKAIREVLLNALMHRDYSVFSETMTITVEMYRDRIEISSPGGLYGRAKVQDLGNVKTEIRNATLVHILEMMRIAENRHSGIPTIRLEMSKNDLPAPLFEDNRGLFKVTLRNHYIDLIEYTQTPRSRADIATFLGVTADYAMSSTIAPLLEDGKLLMTIPEKPKSKLQKYVSCAPPCVTKME